MASETFSVVALPHSCAADAPFHVSLFVAPKLVPDDVEERLDRFRLFPRWGALAAGPVRIELSDQFGPIDARPLQDQVDPAVWDATFPPETPVRGQPLPPWQQRRWRSFAARTVHDLGKAVHLATMYADPTTPPAPDQHPLTDIVREVTGGYGTRPPHREGFGDRDRRRIYDESLATEDLDRVLESAESSSLAFIERYVGGRDNWFERITLELHRARRFYERPEAQQRYRDRPVEGLALEGVPRPEPEFHERCATAGDHPALLRRLGLVLDLVVDEPGRLRESEWLSARIDPDGDPGPCQVSRTRCRAVDDALVTVPGGDEWMDGLARLGDTERFALLELDADGTALKMDRFIWTLPRLLAVADDAPTNAATPALRSGGFTVARVSQGVETQDRLRRQDRLQRDLAHRDAPELLSEDVARGLRVEVWDDEVGRWHSLHRRRTTLLVDGFGPVLEDAEEDGFIQGTPVAETAGVDDSPIHVHEAVFGWEGWSLSAPRPGRRIRNEKGRELPPEETPTTEPDPVHPILVTNRVAPGTLPRLRFGRSYAMRAWLVDLAGNVRPHLLNPPPAPPERIGPALAAALAGAPAALDAARRLPPELRAATHAVLEARRLLPGVVQATDLPQLSARLGTAADPILARLAARRPISRPLGDVGPADRRTAVARSFGGAVGDPDQVFVRDVAATASSALVPVVAAHGPALTAGPPEDSLPLVLDTVTPLVPFLRWDPLPSPAIVPRARFTEGESLRVLVVRSGVTQDLDTLAITVTPPAGFAADVAAEHAGLDLRYADRTERHLAPPKTSQAQAELHGTFDDAIGSLDPADHQRLLGVALRENGSFFDLDVADVDHPPDRIPQPSVRLEHQAATPHAVPVTLPLLPPEEEEDLAQHPERRHQPSPGQYVVHDVDALVLPYLPDPLAAGVSMVFDEAGRDRAIPFPFGSEGVTARYTGKWPDVAPFRLELTGADALAGTIDGRTITMALPPADVQRIRLASSMERECLDWMGPWRSLPPSVHDDPAVREAAADGWLWGLTPHEQLTLVHAVPRPLEAPRPFGLKPSRQAGSTQVHLLGAVDLHGPSTELLTAEAAWTDPVDDLTLPRWEPRQVTAVAFSTPVLEFEDVAVLLGPTVSTPADITVPVANYGPVRIHLTTQELGDTRHRLIQYRFRASTRFREYFHPDLLAAPPAPPPAPGADPPPPNPLTPTDDGRSVVGPLVAVSVPSSARPGAPVVHSVLPLFRWTGGTEAEQPMGRRQARRSGVRIYLERPWFSSGDGELLGVLLSRSADDSAGGTPADGSGFPFVSKWGRDPAWLSAQVDARPLPLVALDDLMHTAHLDDRPRPGRPVVGPVDLPLASLPEQPVVTVLGYRPQYNEDRRLWYVDVAMDPGTAFWPFVRLAVARYQPDSLDGMHLSPPVRCDFVQVPPSRATSVSRTDDRHVRVVLSGPIGARGLPGRRGDAGPDAFAEAVSANRRVIARLQRRDPLVASDLGWLTVASQELAIRGRGASQFEAAWVGELDAGEPVPLTRPGANLDWRVTVEEWERLPGDPRSPLDGPPRAVLLPVWEQRLIFADELAL